MANLVERRCSCCGNTYKHEEAPSYISFCPNCKKDGFFEPYYTDNGIMPCLIFLGEETIGEMTSVSESSYIIISDKFDIHERIDDSFNPYLEAIDILCYMIIDPNKVTRLLEKIKRRFLRENPDINDNDCFNIVTVQAIVEVMKRIYDKEMRKNERTLEKTFFGNLIDRNNDQTYESEKQKLKRDLKNIEKFRYTEGQKLENLSGTFPEEFKSLKRESDKTKINFESNYYNISCQNAHEIKTLDKLAICKAILYNRISSVKKISVTKFEELYAEYDNYYADLIDNVSASGETADKYLSVMFDLFNFEDKFSLEWIYSFADFVVENNITDDVFDRAQWLYVSHIKTPHGAFCMNRSIFLKKKYLPELLKCDNMEFRKKIYDYALYVELVFALKKEMISDSMLEEIPKTEWVYFLKGNYDLFGAFNRDKYWIPEKIRMARKVFDKWCTN